MNDFASTSLSWLGIAENWFSIETVNLLDSLEPALTALNKANHALSMAESDVGGEIVHSISSARITEILDRWMDMKTFVDSIHYEVDEKVDVPFVQTISVPLQEAYDIDPKDFSVSRKLLWFFPYELDLASIVSDIIDDSVLSAAFRQACNSLNGDEVFSSLKDALTDAEYWQTQFEVSARIRTLEDDFCMRFGGAWETMSPEERKAEMDRFVLDLGEAMGPEIVDTVRWLKADPYYIFINRNVYGIAHPFDENDTTIYANKKFATDPFGSHGLRKLLNTLVHESRHQYQGEASSLHPERFNLPSALVELWAGKQEGPYWYEPLEIDARAFAALSQN